MKTVLELIRKAGGWHPGLYFKITNESYMALVIEPPTSPALADLRPSL
ncbi:DUF6908 domain-containing protein [Granulicella cerasi]|uniref:DUF6908 domain-containing protein n=1 Tax=Granulicella cerasi TaxID=741063 RepID=A0ABW1ZDP9_9BACT